MQTQKNIKFSFWSGKSMTTDDHDSVNQQWLDKINAELDQSSELLAETTAELRHAAVNAINVIQDHISNANEVSAHIDYIYKRMDQLNDIIIIKDKSMRWQLANKSAKYLLNIKTSDIHGKTNDQIAKDYPHLKDLMTIHNKLDEKVLKTGMTNRSKEYFFCSITKKFVLIDAVRSPIKDDDNQIYEISYSGRDNTHALPQNITEIKEDIVLQTLELVSLPLIIVDNQANIIFHNTRFIKKFNLSISRKSLDDPYMKMTDLSQHFNFWASRLSQKPLYDIWDKIKETNKQFDIKVFPDYDNCIAISIPENCYMLIFDDNQ